MKKAFVIFMTLILLAGCSNKPENIRAEIWNDTVKIIKILDNHLNKKSKERFPLKVVLDYGIKYRHPEDIFNNLTSEEDFLLSTTRSLSAEIVGAGDDIFKFDWLADELREKILALKKMYNIK